MQRPRPGQRLGRLIAAATGWRLSMPADLPRRCVVIGAPHTSGWDLALTLLLMLAGGVRLRWVGKESLFRGPQGAVLRAVGGLPVRREGPGDFVAQMVAAFAADPGLRLAILPEGTRSRSPHWRTGFYYIALGAGVPIVLGFADYRRRVVGLGPSLAPSGDIAADMALIGQFYAGVQGRHPGRQGPVALGPDHGR